MEKILKGNLGFVFIIAHGAQIGYNIRGHLRSKTGTRNVHRILEWKSEGK